ncbi:MAG TPA: MgtC/SapB family protein [Devosia sp.]|mgnify:CR=1 FL=1|nr:MgtC/SapB family protein [Devosia sp.]
MEQLTEVWNDVTTSFQATPPLVAAARLLVAAILGGIIGFEREVNARNAGLRTHILISLGACLFALLAFEIIEFSVTIEGDHSADPLRLISSVTSGVAFLAAGSIIVTGGKVKGLTTGAGMWMAGAIGLACGIGKIGLAAMACVFVLLTLTVVTRLKRGIVEDAETEIAKDDG